MPPFAPVTDYPPASLCEGRVLLYWRSSTGSRLNATFLFSNNSRRPLVLGIARVADFQPPFSVRTVLQLCDDSFEITLARETEELAAGSLDVIRVQQHGRLFGYDAA